MGKTVICQLCVFCCGVFCCNLAGMLLLLSVCLCSRLYRKSLWLYVSAFPLTLETQAAVDLY